MWGGAEYAALGGILEAGSGGLAPDMPLEGLATSVAFGGVFSGAGFLDDAVNGSLSIGVRVSSGFDGEILPVIRLRTIGKGEKIDALIEELALGTYESGGLEHAIISLKNGSRVIVRGGSGGIEFGEDIKRVILHTHPVTTGPSPPDFDMLRQLGQKHSYIYELFGGGLSRFGL